MSSRDVTPSPPFEPCAVADVDISVGRSVDDVTGLGAYRRALVLVRLDGIPLGYVAAPVESGRIDRTDFVRRIIEGHKGRLVRRLIARRLAGNQPERRDGDGVPSVSVVVCTRNRPADLALCLASLDRLVYADLEVLVVDNAADDAEAERVVAARERPVRYVREPRPGLSWARRRGIAEARGQIIAFVDDDVQVDPKWAQAIATRFVEQDVAGVLGLVAPLELETEAQQEFEWHGGFGRGFDRRWLRRRVDRPTAPDLASTGVFGTGANMAFRRTVFSEVGLFDANLGAGTSTEGGEDLDMIFRVLEAGHTIAYEPAALVWHRHRRERSELLRQCLSWGRGMSAYLTRSWCRYRSERRGLATLARQLLFDYHPRRVLRSVVDRRLRVRLTVGEWYGAMTGAWRYLRASRRQPWEPTTTSASSTHRLRTPPQPAQFIDLNLDETWPDFWPNERGHDRLPVRLVRKGEALGTIEVIAGGRALSRQRVVDAVVAEIDSARLDPTHSVSAEVQAWFSENSS